MPSLQSNAIVSCSGVERVVTPGERNLIVTTTGLDVVVTKAAVDVQVLGLTTAVDDVVLLRTGKDLDAGGCQVNFDRGRITCGADRVPTIAQINDFARFVVVDGVITIPTVETVVSFTTSQVVIA